MMIITYDENENINRYTKAIYILHIHTKSVDVGKFS